MQLINQDFRGTGWSFPFAIRPGDGRIDMVSDEDDIRQSIHIILSTAKGERVMRPDFGCGIHDLVFSVINTALIGQVERDVAEALRQYEARIEVEQIMVDQRFVNDGRLEVRIEYHVRATNQSGNFVYPFYFKEAE